MNKTALISVVVPAYNVADFLAQCLDNLLAQTYKNLEIIVIDDGSIDQTAEIAKQYSSIKYVYQPNGGVSVARNRGIDEASGEYVHFVDADDLLTLDFYEKMVEAVVDSDYDMACCGFYFERTPSLSQRIEHKTIVSRTEDKLLMTNVCSYGACWRYLFKLSFLQKQKLYFEEGIIAGEDRIFSLKAVFFANQIVLVPHATYIYKHRKGSVTATKNLKITRRRHQDRRLAKKIMIEFATQHNFALDSGSEERRWQFKFLGLTLMSKRIFNQGKTRWYFMNIPVFQKKEIGR